MAVAHSGAAIPELAEGMGVTQQLQMVAVAALAGTLVPVEMEGVGDLALAAAAVSVFLGKEQAVRAAQPLQVVRGLPALAALAAEGLVLVDFKGVAQGLEAAAVLAVLQGALAHQIPDVVELVGYMVVVLAHQELIAVTPELGKLVA